MAMSHALNVMPFTIQYSLVRPSIIRDPGDQSMCFRGLSPSPLCHLTRQSGGATATPRTFPTSWRQHAPHPYTDGLGANFKVISTLRIMILPQRQLNVLVESAFDIAAIFSGPLKNLWGRVITLQTMWRGCDIATPCSQYDWVCPWSCMTSPLSGSRRRGFLTRLRDIAFQNDSPHIRQCHIRFRLPKFGPSRPSRSANAPSSCLS